MAPRAQLQALLEVIVPHVYFQPPDDVDMIYPAIVYERARANTAHADNRPYTVTKQYQLTLITQNPDDTAFDAIAALSSCVHERNFPANGLNHDVFNLYF
jgi:hypothetical protein